MKTSLESAPVRDFSDRSTKDVQEFEAMMSQTRRRAYTMAVQLTRNPSEAEDLVQDTFVKAWKGYDSYVPGRPFLNWLLRIMQHAYLDMRRRENPIRKAESLGAYVNPNDGEVQELNVPDRNPGPEDEVVHAEFTTEVHAALNELPDVYRDAIVQCDIEGLSYGEIAERQNTTIGTVRSRIHRGRKLLREIVLRRNRLTSRIALD